MLELFRKYRTPLGAGFLVLTALLIYSANLRQRGRTTLFEKTVLQITSPLFKGVDAVSESLVGGWNQYLWLIDTEQENVRLQSENRRLAAELNSVEEIRLANERLRRLLEFRDSVDLPALPAQVIAVDASSWFRTVVIDKGNTDGVREGMPVVAAEGIVGRVIRSAPRESRVLLLTDASSAVASLVQRNRTRGVVRGQGDILTLDFALRQKDIEVGDRIVTSGTGGVFPKGLVIGEVTRAAREQYGLFQTVTVAPVVDFARLEEVLVLLKENP
jgi:rod shape-determining protein MreC